MHVPGCMCVKSAPLPSAAFCRTCCFVHAPSVARLTTEYKCSYKTASRVEVRLLVVPDAQLIFDT